MKIPYVGPPTISTSDGYATDGDGDGLADVWNPADAISAAARLLRANGAPADYRAALLAYNQFVQRLRQARGEMEDFTLEFLNLTERNFM